jgi:hypothetical protein
VAQAAIDSSARNDFDMVLNPSESDADRQVGR